MAVLIVEEVTEVRDVVELITYLAGALASGNTDPRQAALLEPARHEGAVPYITCSNRGHHALLTECWMCWSDVQRGAITVEQAIQESTHAR